MADPQAQEHPFDALHRQFLIDLNGDGVPDVATNNPAVARAAQNVARPPVMTVNERRDVQRRSMAGRDLTPRQQQQLEAALPEKEARGESFGVGAARMMLPFSANVGLEGLSMLAPTPAEGGDQGGGPASDEFLQSQARNQAARRAAEPTVWNALLDSVRGRDFTPMEMEQFRTERQRQSPRPQPLSETEYVAQQAAAVRNSGAYKTALERGQTKTAENRVAEAEARARKEYPDYVQRAASEGSRWDEGIASDYGTYKQELENQNRDYNNRSFADRNPLAGAALTYGPLVLGAIGARKAFKGYNAQGEALIDDIAKARQAGDVAGELAATKALETWRNQDYYTTIAKTAGKVGGASVAGRGLMDISDRYLMPEGSGARERVANKYTVENLPNLGVEYGINALAGLEAPAIGAMMTKGGPRILARKYTNALDPSFAEEAANFAKLRGQTSSMQGDALRQDMTNTMLQKQLEGVQAATPPRVQFQNPQPVALPPVPGAGGPVPPGGIQGPLGGQQPVNPPVPPPNPPPGLTPSNAGRGSYGDPQKAVVRPFIESEVAAGRNVPATNEWQQQLTMAGVPSQLPKTIDGRQQAAQQIVDTLRQQGLPDAQIATIIRDLMQSGMKGLPAIGGAYAARNALMPDADTGGLPY